MKKNSLFTFGLSFWLLLPRFAFTRPPNGLRSSIQSPAATTDYRFKDILGALRVLRAMIPPLQCLWMSLFYKRTAFANSSADP